MLDGDPCGWQCLINRPPLEEMSEWQHSLPANFTLKRNFMYEEVV
jgi:hypothetical protein